MNELRPAIVSFLVMTALTGLAYPLVLAALAQAALPRQAGGSLVYQSRELAGSELIGQGFTAPGDFQGRPAAVSNLAPGDPELHRLVRERVASMGAGEGPIPPDLVTGSGSGLDPHISPAAALWQVPRVARARGLDDGRVADLVRAHTEGRQWGFLGEPRVNVLRLNLALDALAAP